MIHVYRTDPQPYTRWRIGMNILPKPGPWVVNASRKQTWCESCYRRRYAKNLVIYVYYDGARIVCKGECERSSYRERQARLRKLRRSLNGNSAKGE